VKLADVSLLVAMSDAGHPQFAAAEGWAKANQFATCPITEIGLVRVMIQLGSNVSDALTHLENIKKRADFIPCDVPGSVLAGKVTGHKQTTDVYLRELAAAHQGKLYTLDAGIKGAELVQ